MDFLALILEFVAKYPALGAALVVIGGLRIVFKPIMTAIHAIVDVTPGESDNLFLAKVEGSAIYKGFIWVVDFLASIKLPGAK